MHSVFYKNIGQSTLTIIQLIDILILGAQYLVLKIKQTN